MHGHVDALCSTDNFPTTLSSLRLFLFLLFIHPLSLFSSIFFLLFLLLLLLLLLSFAFRKEKKKNSVLMKMKRNTESGHGDELY